VDRTGEVTGVPLAGSANIEDLRVGSVVDLAYQVIDRRETVRGGAVAERGEIFDAGDDPELLVVADSLELGVGFDDLLALLREEHNRRIERDQPTRPHAGLVAELDAV
jgi:hypothetical protein